MRIGIDCRLYNEAGVGRYIKNLIKGLEKLDKQNEYFLFLREEHHHSTKFNNNFHKVLADYPWYGFKEQVQFPRLINKYELDLMHFPHFNVPFFYKGEFVVTIHDLIHQHFKMLKATTRNPIFYQIKHLGYKRVFARAVNRSKIVLVPSDFIKEQVVSEWHIPSSRIVVTYEAVEDKILSMAKKLSQVKMERILDKFNIRPPFIFYIGNAHPHKNLEGLIRAFLGVRKQYQYLQLVLSGKDHVFWSRIKKEYTSKDIIYTGYVDDDEMVTFYKNAKMFVMPSKEEGFGLPILEAMACGTPVVSSGLASLPEIGGDACVYFSPRDIDDMKQKIIEVLNNETLRKDLISKGLKRCREFNWNKLSRQTLEVYKNAGSHSS